jgi:hypothetical protein
MNLTHAVANRLALGDSTDWTPEDFLAPVIAAPRPTPEAEPEASPAQPAPSAAEDEPASERGPPRLCAVVTEPEAVAV